MMGMGQEQGQRSGQAQHELQEGQQQQQPMNPQPSQEPGQRLDQTTSLQQSLQNFVWQENALLDEGRFDEWYELFAQDGMYWIPGESGQESPEGRMCIALENRMLMRLRIDRLSHHRAFSLQPGVRGLRVIQHPRVQSEHPDEDGCYTVRTNLIYSEYQKQKNRGSARYCLLPFARRRSGLGDRGKAGGLAERGWLFAHHSALHLGPICT